jgi:hypothetical protein
VSDVLNSLLDLALGVLVIGAPVAVLVWWHWRERRRWAREALEVADHQRGEIKREARRRLGLPEEEAC